MEYELPPGISPEMDLAMRHWLEIVECEWIKNRKTPPSCMDKKLVEVWFKHNGFRRNKRSIVGWRKTIKDIGEDIP